MTSDRKGPEGLCLVIPCFNEAHRLNVEAFRIFLTANERVEAIFVDDGSRDGTARMLARMREEFPHRASILTNRQNKGKAESVRLGIRFAIRERSPEFIGFWDADLATPLEAVSRLLTVLELDSGLEMVFGARIKLLGRHVERRALRHYLGRVFATIVSLLLRMEIYDTQCGAKIFRVRQDSDVIFGTEFISRWVFDVEILARYLTLYGNDPKLLEQKIYEYPLEKWVDIAGSKVKPTDFIRALMDIFRIWRRYL